jgi:Flp pilus assembly CpaE family ATPase
LELHPSFGAFALHLKWSPVENLTHLLKLEPARIDKRALSARLYTTAAGLQALFGPQTIEEFGPLEPARTEALVKQASRAADYTVIDLPNEPSAAAEAVVQLCDLVMLVIEPEPTSLGAGKVMLQLLEKWGVSRGQIYVVIVNRSGLSTALPLKEVRAQLRSEIIGVMPFAGEACVAALNQGVPVALYKPDHTAATTLREMANRLTADPVVGLRL